MEKFKLVHYVNQFYGQIGGEEKADQRPILKDGSVGPGVQLQSLLNDSAEIVATVICGDTYFAENTNEAIGEILELIKYYEFDGFIAGPAFNAGRYGIACGAICKAVQEKFQVPVLTSMYPENPGVDLYSKDIYILKCGKSAANMREALNNIGRFITKLLEGREIGFPEEEGYIPQGRRVNVWAEEIGAVRAVNMLLKKMKGEEFETELPMPIFDRVKPAPPVKDMENSIIALVTTGGIVPKNNPDHIESANASKFGKYNIEGLNDLKKGEYETVHGGFDPVYALDDPDRVLPLDAMRVIEKEGVIGKLYNYFYTTVGNTTAVSSAERFGEAIAKELISNGVSGAILTST